MLFRSDKDISFLYQKAKFLAFCSYTEGFGLPIIESILRGTPVIASDIPVSREVAGEYCVYFEQDNVQDLCDKIEFYSKDHAKYLKMKRRLQNFTCNNWDQSAEMMKKGILEFREALK